MAIFIKWHQEAKFYNSLIPFYWLDCKSIVHIDYKDYSLITPLYVYPWVWWSNQQYNNGRACELCLEKWKWSVNNKNQLKDSVFDLLHLLLPPFFTWLSLYLSHLEQIKSLLCNKYSSNVLLETFQTTSNSRNLLSTSKHINFNNFTINYFSGQQLKQFVYWMCYKQMQL